MLAPQSKRTQLDSENVQSVELFITIELCIIELSQFRYTVLLFVFPPFAGKFVWCIFTGEWNTMANTKRRNPNANWTNIQFFLLICFFSPFKMGKHISTPTFPFRCIRFSKPSQFSNFFTIFFPCETWKFKWNHIKNPNKRNQHRNVENIQINNSHAISIVDWVFVCVWRFLLFFFYFVWVAIIRLIISLFFVLQFLYFRLNDGALECLWVFVLSPFQFVVQ